MDGSRDRWWSRSQLPHSRDRAGEDASKGDHHSVSFDPVAVQDAYEQSQANVRDPGRPGHVLW
jgi:hypothetical protein